MSIQWTNSQSTQEPSHTQTCDDASSFFLGDCVFSFMICVSSTQPLWCWFIRFVVTWQTQNKESLVTRLLQVVIWKYIYWCAIQKRITMTLWKNERAFTEFLFLCCVGILRISRMRYFLCESFVKREQKFRRKRSRRIDEN